MEELGACDEQIFRLIQKNYDTGAIKTLLSNAGNISFLHVHLYLFIYFLQNINNHALEMLPHHEPSFEWNIDESHTNSDESSDDEWVMFQYVSVYFKISRK